MDNSLILRILKSSDAKGIAGYAHEGDAGLDLCANENIALEPFERAVVSCGFSMAIPVGYAGLVLPRSGLASKYGISVVNSPGLIDSGYRGEIKVALINLDSKNTFRIHIGDRIAQLLIISVPEVVVEEAEELDITQRNECGFGSSGLE